MKHPTLNTNRPSPKLSQERGSILLTALFFAVVISLITTSFMNYAMTEYKLEFRTHENARLLYAAEGGADDAVWSINNQDWNGWNQSVTGKDMFRIFKNRQTGSNRIDQRRVLVRNYGTNPVIFSEASSMYDDGSRMSKQIRVRYNLGGGIGAGIIAKDKLYFKTQPVINAYDSAMGPPSSTNISDQVVVATASPDDDDLELKLGAEIYGYLATGGGEPKIDKKSRLWGEDTEEGVTFDWNRVSNDFTYDFPEVAQPDWSSAIKVLSIPKNSTVVMGVPGSSVTTYDIKEINLDGGTTLKVVGPVKMYLEKGLEIRGTAQIEIAPGGSLEIYTPEKVDIGGNGMVNKTGSPKNLKILGTADGSQDFRLSSSAQMEAVVYMPNGDVELDGDGVLLGSITGEKVTFDGSSGFHYDIQLAGAGEEEIGIVSWHELIKPTDRINIEGYLAGLPLIP